MWITPLLFGDQSFVVGTLFNFEIFSTIANGSRDHRR